MFNGSNFVALRTHENETAAKGQKPSDGVRTILKLLLRLRLNNGPSQSKVWPNYEIIGWMSN